MKRALTKLYTLASLLIATSAWAGPFVSEGPGPVGDLLTCKGQKSGFVIRHTAAVNIQQGLYQPNRRSGKDAVSMECDLNQAMWSCQELSQLGGENLLYARAYENTQGVVTAQLFQKNMAGLEVLVDTLLCKL